MKRDILSLIGENCSTSDYQVRLIRALIAGSGLVHSDAALADRRQPHDHLA
jgi:hypothetical protein